MTKTISLFASFFVVLALLPSCRKCYVCHNSCSVCSAVDSTGGTISLHICSDSSTYAAQKASLISSGYTCVAAPYTYTDQFCVNVKKAADQYLPYHEGDGAYTCTPK